MDTTTFANSIRTKFPDGQSSDGRAYKDIPDAELTHKIVEKYPVYKDQITDYKPYQAEPSLMDTMKTRATEVVENPVEAGKGFIKRAINTATDVTKGVESVGKGAMNIMGMDTTGAGLDYAPVEELTTASNEAQRGGGNIEQGAEFYYGGGKELLKGGAKMLAEKGPAIIESGKTLVQPLVKKGEEYLANKNVSKITDLLNPTEDLMTAKQKKEAITEGRQIIKNTKLGGTEVGYTPTEETQRAAELLKDVVKSGDKPNTVFAKIGSKIATLGAQGEKYLADAKTFIDAGEHRNAFTALKDAAKETMTPTALKHYDDELQLFANQLPNPKNGVISSVDYYKALKKWEQNIAENIPKGKDAIIDPTGIGSARIHAASDIRKVARDLIASKNPEFKDKMYDLASLFEAKGNALQIAAKQTSKSLLEKYPKTTNALKAAATVGGIGYGVNQGIDIMK